MIKGAVGLKLRGTGPLDAGGSGTFSWAEAKRVRAEAKAK